MIVKGLIEVGGWRLLPPKMKPFLPSKEELVAMAKLRRRRDPKPNKEVEG